MNSPVKSNRILWDSLADLHIDDPWYQLSDFLTRSTSLKASELPLMDDIEGKSIWHFAQGHFGLESMSGLDNATFLHRDMARPTKGDVSLVTQCIRNSPESIARSASIGINGRV